MKKNLIVLRNGEIPGRISAVIGKTADLIATYTGIPRANIDVYTQYNHEYPNLKNLSPLVVTGSPHRITDHHEWNKRTIEILRGAAHKKIPIISMCYGHQLVAEAFGGVADFHHTGEYGTIAVFLTEEGKKDTLFSALDDKFYMTAIHEQTVTYLPEGAKLLAFNACEKHQAWVLNDNIWGMQFHPEFPPEVAKTVLEDGKKGFYQSGFDVASLIANLAQDNKDGETLLRRFAQII